jgi:hypothetical protein
MHPAAQRVRAKPLLAQGATFAKKARNLKNARVTTVVSPATDVIEQKIRSERARGKKLVRNQDHAWRERQRKKDD